MAAGQWVFTNNTRTKILDGTFASGGSYKMCLLTSSSNISASSTSYASLTGEVGTTNTGYATGGISVIPVLSGTTSVTWKTNNPQWTAGSAGLTAKFGAIYKVGGDVVCYVPLDSGGADVTTTSGNTLTVDCTTNPVFTLA
ncbi:hypothetical protein [Mycolicibacterium sphagni]|uniref:Uncharacterized protein n=1 Tax=Mycolicibacterium sphagni TaxID=1786 RepID=A0A255DQR2_9MYCO|nr:hypothetical protein [Mycolicibacterium sphagni]OYN81787.1 hypothetical protein CG716_05445 [Mycolicibacterium sphagni]